MFGSVRLFFVSAILLCAWLSASYGATTVKANTKNPEMKFTVVRLDSALCEPICPEWIQAEGEITNKTPDKFAKLLTNQGYRKLPVLLNSTGGKVYAAMTMGRMIRKYDMATVVAQSYLKSCSSLQLISGTCMPDDKASSLPHLGGAVEVGSYCHSACTLLLMAGTTRIAGPEVLVGLHQPQDDVKHWVDHYWDTWKMVNGKKVITSHRFIKRTYTKSVHVVGVTPELKPKYLQYFKEMGISPMVLDEMAKASPENLNYVSPVYSGDLRQRLGITTSGNLGLEQIVSADHCKTYGKLSANCVERKQKEPQTSVAP